MWCVRSKHIGGSDVEAWTRVASEWFVANDTGQGHSDELVWAEYVVDTHRSVPTLTTTVPASLQAALQEAGLRYEWPDTETTERGLVMTVDRYGADQFSAIIEGLRPHCARVASTSETEGSSSHHDHHP
jgi:hypothetical protein